MSNELDTLATALYVQIDDALKAQPQLAPWRPKIGITPMLSDAELVTLAVLSVLLGFTSERRWLRYARTQLKAMFPSLPGQPAYNRRLRHVSGLVMHMIRMLAADTTLWSDDVWMADSTPIECGRSRETAKRSQLAGWAQYGYCASHSRYFWGLHARAGPVGFPDAADLLRRRPARGCGRGGSRLRRAGRLLGCPPDGTACWLSSCGPVAGQEEEMTADRGHTFFPPGSSATPCARHGRRARSSVWCP
ncbi:hypothetical protein GCM10020219_097040 [Nonomuraea dietziae]